MIKEIYMTKNIRLFPVLAALLLAVVIFSTGCGDKTKPIKITMFAAGNKPTNGRLKEALLEINKRLIPELGAEFDIRFIEWSNWTNRYQLALASGDTSFDMIITATDWLFAWDIVRRGGFYPLTQELLEKNAPRTWAEVTPEHWDICTKNGYIWFIPEDQFTQSTNGGIYWRLDWGREGGVEQVTSFEELETYFDAIKKYHPEAYPWDTNGNNFGDYLRCTTNTQPIIGTASGGIFYYDNDDPYTVVSPFIEGQELIDAANMFYRWNQKGFWREDLLNSPVSTRALFFDGLSGAETHHAMTYYSVIRPAMDKRQPGSEVQFFCYGLYNNNINKDLITHGAMAINPSSRNPELALRVYDYLRNDREIYMLLNYGIEGVDYIIRPDGKLGRPEGWDAAADALGSNFWGGRMDKFEPFNEDWWDGAVDLVDHIKNTAHDYPLEKFSFNNIRVTAEAAALTNVCSIHLGLLACGKTQVSPEEAVANFRRDLKAAGYDRVKAEIQSQLDALKAENVK